MLSQVITVVILFLSFFAAPFAYARSYKVDCVKSSTACSNHTQRLQARSLGLQEDASPEQISREIGRRNRRKLTESLGLPVHATTEQIEKMIAKREKSFAIKTPAL